MIKLTDKCRPAYKRLKSQAFWGDMTFLVIESYLQVMICSALTIDSTITRAVILPFFAVVLPLIFIYQIYLSYSKAGLIEKTNPILKQFGVFHMETVPDNRQRAVYYLLFMLRRQIFVVIAFTLTHPAIQIISLVLISTLFMIFNGLMIKTNRRTNRLEYFNDFCLLTIMVHLLCFTDWVSRNEV